MSEPTAAISFEELSRFIATTRSTILPERVATFIRGRDVGLEAPERWAELLAPLVEDLRRRLAERGIDRIARVKRLDDRRAKTHRMLASLAELLPSFAHALLEIDQKRARQAASEAERIGEVLEQIETVALANDLLALCDDRDGLQESAITRLRRSVELGIAAEKPEIIGRALHNIGSLLSERSRPEEAVTILREATERLEEAGQYEGLALALGRLASTLRSCGKIGEAFEAIERAEEVSSGIANAGTTLQILLVRASLARASGRLAEAMESYRTATTVARRIPSPNDEADALVEIGVIATEIGETEEADRLYHEAIDLYSRLESPAALTRAHVRVGDALSASADHQGAIEAYRTALSMMTGRNATPGGISYCRSGIGGAFAALGRYDEAEEEYRAALAVADEAGVVRASLVITARLAEIAQTTNRIDDAKELFEQVLLSAPDDATEACDAHRTLAEIAKNEGAFAAAYTHLEEHGRISTILQERRHDARLDELRVTHEVERYRQEAEQERLRRQEQEEELQHLSVDLLEKGELIGLLRKEVRTVLDEIESERSPAVIRTIRRLLRHVEGADPGRERPMIHLHSVDDAYYERLAEAHPDLTPGQRRLCGVLRSEMAPQTILETLHLSSHALRKARHRLRKRLGLGAEERLEEYLRGL